MSDKSLWRNLGEFFGHIAKGVKTDVTKASANHADEPARRVIKEETTEETRDTPAGPVKLRRTVIEEVELPPSTDQP